ncbi:MAG: lipid-binding SYLF domain-containing protein [Atribacterota bacterium]
MKRLLIAIILCFVIALPLLARENLIIQSRELLEELEESVDRSLFTSLLRRAEGVAIFPEVKRVGLFLGGYFGEGLVLRKDKKGRFFGPAFLKIEGLSVGPQIGVQVQGLVLLLMNRQGIEAFYKDGFTLGGNISIAAGPLGRGFSAGVDTELSSSIYAYAIARGFFAGISIEGARIRDNKKANEAFFGRKTSVQEILTEKQAEDRATRELIRTIRRLRLGEGEET